MSLHREYSMKNDAQSTCEKMPQKHFLPKVCLPQVHWLSPPDKWSCDTCFVSLWQNSWQNWCMRHYTGSIYAWEAPVTRIGFIISEFWRKGAFSLAHTGIREKGRRCNLQKRHILTHFLYLNTQSFQNFSNWHQHVIIYEGHFLFKLSQGLINR